MGTRPIDGTAKMGKLLSLLARDDSNCCTPKNYDVFLDFENAAPTEIEREIYDEVERVLRESESVLDEIQCYKVRLIVICLCLFFARPVIAHCTLIRYIRIEHFDVRRHGVHVKNHANLASN